MEIVCPCLGVITNANRKCHCLKITHQIPIVDNKSWSHRHVHIQKYLLKFKLSQMASIKICQSLNCFNFQSNVGGHLFWI